MRSGVCELPEQAPLADLYAPSEASTSRQLAEPLGHLREAWAARGGEHSLGSPDLRCVLPLPGIGMWPWQVHTLPFTYAFSHSVWHVAKAGSPHSLASVLKARLCAV